MTEQEAIEELKYDCGQLEKSVPCDTSWGQAIDTAYGMAIAALERRIPKKPIDKDNCGNISCCTRCPSCFEIVSENMKYCDNCGQFIDWSEE